MGYGTSTALNLLSDIWEFMLPILIGVGVIVIIIGFFKDMANAIFCIIISVAGIIFSIVLSVGGFDADLAADLKVNDGSWWCLLCAIILHVLMLIRYLPCLSYRTEKSTYLIFGTLVEEKETFLVGGSIVIGMPFVFSLPFYFISLFVMDLGFFSFHYVVFAILLIHSIVGIIRGCVYY